MMKELQFIGNVGKIEEKENSQTVSVAINESTKDGDGYVETTFWISCVVAKGVKVSQGDLVFVRGGFVLDVYKKDNGEPGTTLRCFVNQIKVIRRKQVTEN